MSGPGYGWFKMHDAWMTDAAVSQLLADGRYDAVCVFLIAIAYSRAHDTDGMLSVADQKVIERLANASGLHTWEALIHSGTVVKRSGGRGGARLEIRSFVKWQGASDLRKDEVASRARAGASAGMRTKKDRQTDRQTGARVARPATPTRPPSDGAPTDPRRVFDHLDTDELKRRASLRIAELETGDAL